MPQQTQTAISGQFIFHEAVAEPLTVPGRGGVLEIGQDGTCQIKADNRMAATTREAHTAPASLALDSTPLHSNTQIIDAFGRGFYGPESDLGQKGVHWTNGRGNAYFITRLDAGELWMDYRSPFPDDTRLELIISRMQDAATQTFTADLHLEFWGTRDRLSRLVVPVQLLRGVLYRLTLLSPSMTAPENAQGMPIGIGVVSLKLIGRPFDTPAGTVEQPTKTVEQSAPAPAPARKMSPAAELHTRGAQKFAAGQYDEALMLFHEALTQGGGNSDLWNDYAAANMFCGNNSQAEQGFRLALSLNENNVEPATNLAVLLMRMKRQSEAVALLERMLPRFPGDKQEVVRQLLEACRNNQIPNLDIP